MKNRAAFVLDNRKMEVRDTVMPELHPDEVMIRMKKIGVCGSDVHFYEHGEPEFPDVYPFILGHEGAGEVVEVGAAVSHLKAGDRVCLEPGVPCRVCEWCTSGKYNLCPTVYFPSAPRALGMMRNFITHKADLCFKLPDNVSFQEGALVEPLAVGIHAVRESGIKMGQSATILGSGCIGLVTLLSLKAAGVDDITVVDIHDIRLEKAKELGARHLINASNTDMISAVKDVYGGIGPDFIFETAGNRVTASNSVPMIKRGGTIMIIGNVVGDTPVNFQMLGNKEATIKATFRYRNIYPSALSALSSGRINVNSIVSDFYKFEDTQSAFEDSINNKATVVKAMIDLE
ncbi:NAD(P)-dependent alcohol dehydrogenase [Pantoea rwandensis]|uniref:Alcohol dehydrogenase n=1 Tax=Pantoea rwandensis TaxID=1076550 RepID=A0A1X1D3G7_9GAMM|nr:NAD(P)-dependent alcohol dehydrogenase [Pantoea rwandensis]ORM71187.1 alcohol dehydrogenase [Pantoea rwandensis]